MTQEFRFSNCSQMVEGIWHLDVLLGNNGSRQPHLRRKALPRRRHRRNHRRLHRRNSFWLASQLYRAQNSSLNRGAQTTEYLTHNNTHVPSKGSTWVLLYY